MSRIKTNQSIIEESSNAQVSSERRVASRHQTTIIVKDLATEEPVHQRGDINKDGFFFLPELDLDEGEELVLEVRLPGLGEWVECSGIVSGVAVRGNTRGVIIRITGVTEEFKDAVVHWRRLGKNRSQKTSSAMGSSEHQAN